MKDFVDQALSHLIDANLSKVLNDLGLDNNKKIIAGAMFKGCDFVFNDIGKIKYDKRNDKIIAYRAIDVLFINQEIRCIRYQKTLGDAEYKEQYETTLQLYNWQQLSYEEPQLDNVEQ